MRTKAGELATLIVDEQNLDMNGEIAVLTQSELSAMGPPMSVGFAKILGALLGGTTAGHAAAQVKTTGIPASPVSSNSGGSVASGQISQVQAARAAGQGAAAAMAAMVEVRELVVGKKPMMNETEKWARLHEKKQRRIGEGVEQCIERMMKEYDGTFDAELFGKIISSSISPETDKALNSEVRGTMSAEAYEKYGKGETESGMKLMRNMFDAVYDVDTAVMKPQLDAFKKQKKRLLWRN